MAKMKQTADLRVRLGPDLKGRLDAVLNARKVSQQVGMVEVVEWFVSQDAMVQAMVLGLIPVEDRGSVAKIVLKRLAGDGSPASSSNKGA